MTQIAGETLVAGVRELCLEDQNPSSPLTWNGVCSTSHPHTWYRCLLNAWIK